MLIATSLLQEAQSDSAGLSGSDDTESRKNSTPMKKPDFLVVGAAKAGTTAIFNWLNTHPDIFIPGMKECRYFSQLEQDYLGRGAEHFVNRGVRNQEEYFGLFRDQAHAVCGDISNDYLYYHERARSHILEQLGDSVKILIFLRNPVERAYSNYLHAFRDGWENLTFEQAIIEEPSRIKNHWAWPYHYVQTGLYYLQVKDYLDHFPQCRVYLYEDLEKPEQLLGDVFSFLDVPPGVRVDTGTRHNVSPEPRLRGLHRILKDRQHPLNRLGRPLAGVIPKSLIHNIRRWNSRPAHMAEETRRHLNGVYRQDVERLSELIHRNLNGWVENDM